MPGPNNAADGRRQRDYRKPKNVRGTLRRLFSYLSRYSFLLILVLIAVVAQSILGLASSYLLKPIIDECILPNIGAASQNWEPLKNTLLELAVLYLFTLAATYGQSVLTMILSERCVNKLRADLFEKLQELPISFFDTHGNGEIMSRFTNDADNVQAAIEQGVTSFLSAVITFVGTIYLMIRLNGFLFCFTAVFIVFSVFISRKLSLKSKARFRLQQRELGEVNDYTEEIVQGIRVVKAFNYEGRAVKEFSNRSEKYRDAAVSANSLGMSLMPIISQLMGICYAVTTVIGAFCIIRGGQSGPTAFTIGSLGLYLTYTTQLRAPINNVTNQMVNLMSALAGAERIFNVMDNEPECDDGSVRLQSNGGEFEWISQDEETLPLRGHITLQDVHFQYTENKPVIRGISLEAFPGQKIALVGSTGAGKTTITNLMSRFYDVQEGTITYDGIDIRDIRKSDLRHSMAVVLQDTHLFTGTIMENIRYGRLNATDAECIEAAKTANAYDFIMSLPDGFQTFVTADGSDLSQGQRQLLNISRAVLAHRPVLILDEATSSIDTRTEKMIETGMNRLMEGKTVLIIAHRLSTVRNADKIAVIENGEIVEFGSHKELLEQKGRYYDLYTGQHLLD